LKPDVGLAERELAGTAGSHGDRDTPHAGGDDGADLEESQAELVARIVLAANEIVSRRMSASGGFSTSERRFIISWVIGSLPVAGWSSQPVRRHAVACRIEEHLLLSSVVGFFHQRRRQDAPVGRLSAV
jgi:hypothetical protein